MESPTITINRNSSFHVGSYANLKNNTIYINLKKINWENLTDDELIIRTSDLLVHEFMHILLYEIFDNIDVSNLFDAIGHYFYIDYSLFEKSYENILTKEIYGAITWKNIIKEEGFDYFLERKNVSKIDFKNCKELCNKRK